MLNKINNGMTFWNVDKIKRIFKDLVFKIEINQEWKGLTPNFIKSLKFINK